MSDLRNSPAQALWWFTILASFYLLLKGFINGFYHWFSNFDRLEGRQLWLNPRHCQSAHKDSSLWASQGQHWRSESCWGHYQRGNEASRPPRLNHHRPRVAFHFKVLLIAMLFITFYPQTDGQTDRQNSIMEAYLWIFVNFEQNDWARLLPMAEFAYNNAKNPSTGYTSFKLNCGYYP